MRPGILTTEFWLTVLVVFLTNIGAVEVPEKYRWIITLAAVAGYALSRGLAKYDYGATPPLVGDPEAVSKLDQLEQENMTLKRAAAAAPPKDKPTPRSSKQKAS